MPLELVNEDFNICGDCLMFDAGFDEHETGYAWSATKPPWKLWMEPDGSLPYAWAQTYDEDGEEPLQHFSWSPCPACGSSLGGDRYEGQLFRVLKE